jgi:hypothetical protein
MRNDPFYLFKALTLKASLGVLSVDGNFGNSIAYFKLFVKLNNKVKSWKQWRSVGGDCYHSISVTVDNKRVTLCVNWNL